MGSFVDGRAKPGHDDWERGCLAPSDAALSTGGSARRPGAPA